MKLMAEAEARRVQAEAEAEARRVQAEAEAEARREHAELKLRIVEHAFLLKLMRRNLLLAFALKRLT